MGGGSAWAAGGDAVGGLPLLMGTPGQVHAADPKLGPPTGSASWMAVSPGADHEVSSLPSDPNHPHPLDRTLTAQDAHLPAPRIRYGRSVSSATTEPGR